MTYLFGDFGVWRLKDAEEHVSHCTPHLPAPQLVRQPPLLVARQHVARGDGLGGGAGAAHGVGGRRGGVSLGAGRSPPPRGVGGGSGGRGHIGLGVQAPAPAFQTPTTPATFAADRLGGCDVIVVTWAVVAIFPSVLERQISLRFES